MRVATEDPDPCMVVSTKSYLTDKGDYGVAVVAKFGELEQTLLVVVPTEATPTHRDPMGSRGGDFIKVYTKPLRKEFPAIRDGDDHIIVEKLAR